MHVSARRSLRCAASAQNPTVSRSDTVILRSYQHYITNKLRTLAENDTHDDNPLMSSHEIWHQDVLGAEAII